MISFMVSQISNSNIEHKTRTKNIIINNITDTNREDNDKTHKFNFDFGLSQATNFCYTVLCDTAALRREENSLSKYANKE
jgi:hypothetical protein